MHISLDWIYWAISWILLRWHGVWDAIGVPDHAVLGTILLPGTAFLELAVRLTPVAGDRARRTLDAADAYLLRSLEINVVFGWKYHEATTLVALARSQKRRTGSLDAAAEARLDEAATIAAARQLPGVLLQVESVRP